MNKYDRLDEITKLVNQKGTVRTNEIVEELNVSDMTVRRDLAELEEKGLLTKIHGGARSNSVFQFKEKSHQEKHTQNKEEKRVVARKAVKLIEEGDTIFLGPGTTIEFLAEVMEHQSLTVITNCFPVFKILFKKRSIDFKVYLLGGEMRELTESFVGEMTNTLLKTKRFSKMFFSCNGIKEADVLTSTIDEAYTQQIALERSVEKYLLIDSSKIGKEDFTQLCKLEDLTAVVLDTDDEESVSKLKLHTEVIY
ncbi:lactose phosphotransferase system repressor [Staphylococcus petrasii]|uniref:Lactose phosphotransferase system repressor n=1 Tax=Staphylococcus petrasii TaxID=1276936 RepID=A0A380FYA1_9STAP|nr:MULTISPECIES: DeoR/GlpR family DNA-binding transcription regulator [Staphylococcus]MCI2774649.1 DeoR/GlpR family DNA-binding transcription regulator [Staphylococcus petrasii]MCJ1655833.1 DeoR/GlpR family DNA-binding transcription regulator [Staphylococcus sp. NRL 21/187]MCJ1661643.1 DeoR/GlpR family DNA-binding transcription regulator [Staphylococcus sp. NRL 18/288]MCJ1667568.1 DeoR/GlpR family DNA-binding transcription regulator [Staphylococcus sp. NRL 19/737]PNZ30675.1 DeoR family transcr